MAEESVQPVPWVLLVGIASWRNQWVSPEQVASTSLASWAPCPPFTKTLTPSERARLTAARSHDSSSDNSQPAKDLCLGNIRSYDARPGKKLLDKRRHRVFADKARAARRHHDGIDHDVFRMPLVEAAGNRADDLGRRRHANLHRIGADVGEDRVDLLRDERGGHLVHPRYPERILRGERGDDRLGEQVMRPLSS